MYLEKGVNRWADGFFLLFHMLINKQGPKGLFSTIQVMLTIDILGPKNGLKQKIIKLMEEEDYKVTSIKSNVQKEIEMVEFKEK